MSRPGRKASGMHLSRRWWFVLGGAGLVALGLGVGRWLDDRRFNAELAHSRAEVESGDFATARRRLVLLVARRPGAAEAAYLLGRCEAARGRLDRALGIWERIPADSPWAGAASLEAGLAASAMSLLAKAEVHLRRAVAHRSPPQDAPAARKTLLILLAQQGRMPDARALLESEWSADHEPMARLALLREHVGLDFEPFPLEFNASMFDQGAGSSDPADRAAMALARAHLATQAGDYDQARRVLDTMLKIRPDDVRLWKALLDSARAEGRVDLAEQAIEHLPARALTPSEIAELKAWLAQRGGDLARESAALEALLKLEPAHTGATARLAELREQQGGRAAAAALRTRKAQIDADRDRYNRLYKQDRYADHLPELASLAERLGRNFEARAFRELQRGASAPPAEAPAALASAGPLADLLRDELPRASKGDRAGALDHGPTPWFEDGARAAGLEFVLDNGLSPDHQLPEMSCGGVGLLDFDGDGRLDVYCVQGGRFPPDRADPSSGDRLFRNRGDGTFEDASERTGIAAMPRGYGHGIAVGDYDGDGRPDLFVTRWRSYALYHNKGDGTFEDATARAGFAGDRDWPTSAAFADFDGDGDLDLYVAHYGAWDEVHPRICKDPTGRYVAACDPRVVEPRPDHMFQNINGKFVDMTSEAGIVDREGRGLGVLAADFDGDGRVDVFVANDTTANFLFRNLGGFRFEECALSSGLAASAQGGYQAGMGVARGDLDGDGLLDLAVTNFLGESTTFYHNLGHGLFADHTAAAGLAAPSRGVLGFGAVVFDANNDGRLDLMTANGHVSDHRPLFPYAMKSQLYLGSGRGRMVEVSAQAGPAFEPLYVGRALAVGDLDSDGRLDVVMAAQNDPLVYSHNQTRLDGERWIAFELEGTASNRDGVGTVLTLKSGGKTQVGERFGGGSFQSASSPWLHFGLGATSGPVSIEVRWLSGAIDRHEGLAVDRRYHLREGSTAVAAALNGPTEKEIIKP